MSKGSYLFQDVFSRLATLVASPLSVQLSEYVRSDPKRIQEVVFRPTDYSDPVSFGNDYLLLSLCKKYKGLVSKKVVDPKAAALASWSKQEGINLRTNHRLLFEQASPAVESILFMAQQKIERILGDFSEDEMFDLADYGPGATYSLKRARAQVDVKASHNPVTVTEACLPYFRRLLRSDVHLAESLSAMRTRPIEYDIVPGNRHDTVPKTAFTDRNIAIEPLANSFLQKGVGSMIRRRLLAVGIDLDDQSRNQMLAEQAFTREYATIDLSNASDSVSFAIVEALLPPEWFDVLDDLRSPVTHFNGVWQVQQKFSSMGNGFTFELESLIFYALSFATRKYVEADGPIGIFGDDIIVKRTYAPLLIEVLSWCGFSVNSEKSFLEGNFFESCGRHFFMGVDVTPVYQKEKIHEKHLFEIVRLHNRLYRWMRRREWYPLEGLSSLLKWLRDFDPELEIPESSESDDGFLRPINKLERKFKPNKGFLCKVIVKKTLEVPSNDDALLSVALRRRTTSFEGFITLSKDVYVRRWRWVRHRT